MSLGSFIVSIPTWALFCLFLVVCMLAAEGGAHFASRRVKKGIKEPETPIGTAVGAILGLLAFMLGFTFFLTESRFGNRKNLVIQEANAIGTAYLRTSLIPEKQKLETRKLFREYVEILLQAHETKDVESAFPRLEKLEEMHILIWAQTASLVQEDMDSEVRTFFTGSVNEVIDLFTERSTVGLIFRIPDIIWASLLFLSVFGMFAFGYQTGQYSVRRIFITSLLSASFAMVLIMIVDMDSSGHRFKVSQEPLKAVQRMMQKQIP